MLEPERDLLGDPGRGRGVWRGQQDEVARRTECSLDVEPHRSGLAVKETRRKSAEGPQPVPGFTEALHRRLQRLRDQTVLRVAVGNEGVVPKALASGRRLPAAMRVGTRPGSEQPIHIKSLG